MIPVNVEARKAEAAHLATVLSEFDSSKKDLLYFSSGKVHKWTNTGNASLFQRFFMWISFYFGKKSMASELLMNVNDNQDELRKSPNFDKILLNLMGIFNRLIKTSPEAAKFLNAGIKLLQEQQPPVLNVNEPHLITREQVERLNQIAAKYEMNDSDRTVLFYDFHNMIMTNEPDQVVQAALERKGKWSAKNRNTKIWEDPQDSLKEKTATANPLIPRHKLEIEMIPPDIFEQPKTEDFKRAVDLWSAKQSLILGNREALRLEEPAKLFDGISMLDRSLLLDDELFNHPRDEALRNVKKMLLLDAKDLVAAHLGLAPEAIQFNPNERDESYENLGNELNRAALEAGIQSNKVAFEAMFELCFATKNEQKYPLSFYREHVFNDAIAKLENNHQLPTGSLANGSQAFPLNCSDEFSGLLQAEATARSTRLSAFLNSEVRQVRAVAATPAPIVVVREEELPEAVLATPVQPKRKKVVPPPESAMKRVHDRTLISWPAPPTPQLTKEQIEILKEVSAEFELTERQRQSLIDSIPKFANRSTKEMKEVWKKHMARNAEAENSDFWQKTLRPHYCKEHPEIAHLLRDVPPAIYKQALLKNFVEAINQWVSEQSLQYYIEKNKEAFNLLEPDKFFEKLALQSMQISDRAFSDSDEPLSQAKRQMLEIGQHELARRFGLNEHSISIRELLSQEGPFEQLAEALNLEALDALYAQRHRSIEEYLIQENRKSDDPACRAVFNRAISNLAQELGLDKNAVKNGQASFERFPIHQFWDYLTGASKRSDAIIHRKISPQLDSPEVQVSSPDEFFSVVSFDGGIAQELPDDFFTRIDTRQKLVEVNVGLLNQVVERVAADCGLDKREIHIAGLAEKATSFRELGESFNQELVSALFRRNKSESALFKSEMRRIAANRSFDYDDFESGKVSPSKVFSSSDLKGALTRYSHKPGSMDNPWFDSFDLQ